MGTWSDRGRKRPSRASYWLEPFPVDVSDRGERFVLAASLPGLTPGDISVQARERRVDITAEFGDGGPDRVPGVEGTAHGTVHRRIDLPDPIRKDEATATYLDGVLFVSLEKQPER